LVVLVASLEFGLLKFISNAPYFICCRCIGIVIA
jgi:hypothetical protein